MKGKYHDVIIIIVRMDVSR